LLQTLNTIEFNSNVRAIRLGASNIGAGLQATASGIET
jgi:hypothetical protein